MSELWTMVTVVAASTTIASITGGVLSAKMEHRITGAARRDPRFAALRLRAHFTAFYVSAVLVLLLMHFWIERRGGVSWLEIVAFIALMTVMAVGGEVMLYRRSLLR